MIRFRPTLQCVSDILHCPKKIIYDALEFHIINVRDGSKFPKSLVRSFLPKHLFEILQNENVIMPKAKKVKISWLKIFRRINSNKKRSRLTSSPKQSRKQCRLENPRDGASSASVPESARSCSESEDSDVLIALDSKAEKLREAQQEVITIDSNENEDMVNSMGNVNCDAGGLVCDNVLQPNSGSWHCSATSWAGSNDQSGFSSKIAAKTGPAVLENIGSDDGTSESTTGFFNQEDESKREKLKQKRQWQYTHFGSSMTAGEAKATPYHLLFTIMSYNVLAQDLLESHPFLYYRHNRENLTWEHRSQMLLGEIQEANADILCLQEVQASHLDTFYYQLKDLGYAGIYKKRTGTNVDGVAIYYKTDVFQLTDHTSVEYYQPGVAILDRDNVGLIAKLAIKANPSKHVVVATTHLLFNRNRHDVKLAQVQILLAELERFAFETFRYGTPRYWPVIITGDMNFEPYTGVYRLLTEGMLRYEGLNSKTLTEGTYGRVLRKELLPRSLDILNTCQHWGILCGRHIEKLHHKSDLELLKIHNTDHQRIMRERNMVTQPPKSFQDNMQNARMVGLGDNFVPYFGPSIVPPLPEAAYATGQLTHNLNLRSVYKHGRNNNYHVSEVTTNHGNWVTVDYIFYSCIRNETNEVNEGDLKLVSRYRLLTASEADSFGPIPNAASPSDHYPLLATFIYRF